VRRASSSRWLKESAANRLSRIRLDNSSMRRGRDSLGCVSNWPLTNARLRKAPPGARRQARPERKGERVERWETTVKWPNGLEDAPRVRAQGLDERLPPSASLPSSEWRGRPTRRRGPYDRLGQVLTDIRAGSNSASKVAFLHQLLECVKDCVARHPEFRGEDARWW
jgi:hypothetical protein